MEKLTLKEPTTQNNKEEKDAETKDENHEDTRIESLFKEWRYTRGHPKEQIISDPSQGVRTHTSFKKY